MKDIEALPAVPEKTVRAKAVTDCWLKWRKWTRPAFCYFLILLCENTEQPKKPFVEGSFVVLTGQWIVSLI